MIKEDDVYCEDCFRPITDCDCDHKIAKEVGADLKLCKDCKHQKSIYCSASTDPVEGDHETTYNTRYYGPCGYDGKLWEAKGDLCI